MRRDEQHVTKRVMDMNGNGQREGQRTAENGDRWIV